MIIFQTSIYIKIFKRYIYVQYYVIIFFTKQVPKIGTVYPDVKKIVCARV